MVDWAPMDTPGAGIITHQNAWLAEAYRRTARMAEIMGQKTDAEHYLQLAEKLKQNLSTLGGKVFNEEMMVSGKDLKTASPKELAVKHQLVDEVLEDLLTNYVKLIKRLLVRIPSELISDLIDKGILLSGGLAQLNGLEQYLIEALEIPASVVDDSQQTVIKGMSVVLENLDEFKNSLGYEV